MSELGQDIYFVQRCICSANDIIQPAFLVLCCATLPITVPFDLDFWEVQISESAVHSSPD